LTSILAGALKAMWNNCTWFTSLFGYKVSWLAYTYSWFALEMISRVTLITIFPTSAFLTAYHTLRTYLFVLVMCRLALALFSIYFPVVGRVTF
jgi:hypothetical protein